MRVCLYCPLLDEYDLKNCIIIADRSLSSYKVPEDLASRGMCCIIPLNMKVIDYSIKLDRSFVYIDRGINSGKQKLAMESCTYMRTQSSGTKRRQT